LQIAAGIAGIAAVGLAGDRFLATSRDAAPVSHVAESPVSASPVVDRRDSVSVPSGSPTAPVYPDGEPITEASLPTTVAASPIDGPVAREPGIAPARTGIVVRATGMRRLAHRDESAAVPSGAMTYAVAGSGEVVLEYGARAISGGGMMVALGDSVLMQSGDRAGSGASPDGALTFGQQSTRRGASVPAGAGVRCTDGIRWTDSSGIELRLTGPYSCERLRALAARFTVVSPQP
jgi:hypothetical protein